MLQETESLCDKCLAKIPAKIVENKGKIYLKKTCHKHGETTALHFWDDPEIFRFFSRLDTLKTRSDQAILNVTYRCNLTCPVCYAKANEVAPNDLKVDRLKGLEKFKTVFISGGEPTVRKDLPAIIQKIRKQRCRIVLFSNGIKIADFQYAKELKQAGLGAVILQFDTLDDQTNLFIRGKKLLKIKKRALANLTKLNIKITTSSVILRNKNFTQLPELLDFLIIQKNIKTIGLNPLKELGRFPEEIFVSSSEIVKRVNQILNLKKKDWLASTQFLVDLDNLMSFVKKRNRVFSKCRLKCLFFIQKNTCIPLTKIFNLEKIHSKILRLGNHPNHFKTIIFFVYLLLDQIFLNYLKNKYFRSYFFSFLKNILKHDKKNFSLLNPIKSFSVSVYPTSKNLDFDFIKSCNFTAYSKDDDGYRPACLVRLNEYFKAESNRE